METQKEINRRNNIISSLRQLWVQTEGIKVGNTAEEISGFFSERQIEFFNLKLREFGEEWTIPFNL